MVGMKRVLVELLKESKGAREKGKARKFQMKLLAKKVTVAPKDKLKCPGGSGCPCS